MEFELIRRHFSRLAPEGAGLRLGIGDDCALVEVPSAHELAVTTDTLVAGRHFPLATAPFDIGWKALAVNLSDLAAMGAEARWFTLALTLPSADPDWLEGFADGLQALARQCGVALIGGDTTRGPLSITVTAMGVVPAGAALRRSGARPGDRICVTGTLGDAALALQLLHSPTLPAALRERLDRPQPRLSAGLALRGLATAALDISDGLAGDLGHILAASGGGAELSLKALPASAWFNGLAPDDDRLDLMLRGGDDYELCVCLPPEAIAEARARLDVPLSEIGRIVRAPGLFVIDGAGARQRLDAVGYRHF